MLNVMNIVVITMVMMLAMSATMMAVIGHHSFPYAMAVHAST